MSVAGEEEQYEGVSQRDDMRDMCLHQRTRGKDSKNLSPCICKGSHGDTRFYGLTSNGSS